MQGSLSADLLERKSSHEMSYVTEYCHVCIKWHASIVTICMRENASVI